jgi:hypothetical protein
MDKDLSPFDHVQMGTKDQPASQMLMVPGHFNDTVSTSDVM